MGGGSLPFKFSTEYMPTPGPREPPVTTYPSRMVQSVAKSSFSMTSTCNALPSSACGMESVGAYCVANA